MGSREICKGFRLCSHQAKRTPIPSGQTEMSWDGLGVCVSGILFYGRSWEFSGPVCTISQEFLFIQRIFHVNKDICKLI